jgi:hypothetical protein
MFIDILLYVTIKLSKQMQELERAYSALVADLQMHHERYEVTFHCEHLNITLQNGFHLTD